MHRIITTSILHLVMLLPGLALIPATSSASDTYDVSYLWTHDADGALKYRDKVARVLGPAVARDLKVVARQDLFGLVYMRGGDSAGATRVAKQHTSLLQSRGLDAASPVRSRVWTFYGDGGAPRASTPAVVEQNTARKKMTKTERAREIRNLESVVQDYISLLRRQGKIAADERTGWSVYDFTTGEKLVTINEDMQFQSASLIKPFVATAFFHKVKKGELIYGNKSRRHMERMIQRSNNRSTNWVMRQVGGPAAVQRILKKEYPGIFQDTWVVEYIPVNGRTYRNKASVHDYSRFLYAVWTGEIPKSQEIKRLMALPGSDRIYTGAREIPKGTQVYNKTGSTARLCGDMGILSVKGKNGKRYAYTLIGVIEKQGRAANYSAWIRSRSDIIRNVSTIVYKGIAQQHDLDHVL